MGQVKSQKAFIIEVLIELGVITNQDVPDYLKEYNPKKAIEIEVEEEPPSVIE